MTVKYEDDDQKSRGKNTSRISSGSHNKAVIRRI